jgi:hypothetical protein
MTNDDLRDIIHTATHDALRPAYTDTEIRVRAEIQVQIANAVIAAIREKEGRSVTIDRPDLEEARSSLVLLQMNAEGCLRKHHGDTSGYLPGWLLDTKASIETLTEALYPSQLARVRGGIPGDHLLWLRACEVVHHDEGCPAIGGAGDSDCRCDAVPFLRDLRSFLKDQANVD